MIILILIQKKNHKNNSNNEFVQNYNTKDAFNISKIISESKDTYFADLNAEPYKGAFHYKNYKFLPYTAKSQLEKVKEISFICNINKRDINNRKGLKKLCYGTIVYVKAEKKWYEKTPHSQYCQNLHNVIKKEIDIKKDLDEYQIIEDNLTEYYIKIPILKYDDFKENFTNVYNN